MISQNENIKYEIFVKEIYEALQHAEGINTINVQHNVKLMGLTGCEHQIDIYWEFEISGVKYQTAIECKNYSKKISIGKLRDFSAVLEDIGNINGIFVAREGFQSGAIKFAEQKRIKTMEVRPPNEKDWEGKIKDLFLDINSISVNIINRDLELDLVWLKDNGYQSGEIIEISGMNTEIFIEDIKIGIKESLYDLEKKLSVQEKGKNLKKIFVFEDSFLITRDKRLKIKKMTIHFDVNESTYRMVIKGDNLAKAIIKDVINNRVDLISRDGSVKRIS